MSLTGRLTAEGGQCGNEKKNEEKGTLHAIPVRSYRGAKATFGTIRASFEHERGCWA